MHTPRLTHSHIRLIRGLRLFKSSWVAEQATVGFDTAFVSRALHWSVNRAMEPHLQTACALIRPYSPPLLVVTPASSAQRNSEASFFFVSFDSEGVGRMGWMGYIRVLCPTTSLFVMS